MTIRPFLTFDGDCLEAIRLYEKAFMTKADQIAFFKDMPPNPNFKLPEEMMDRVLQATIKFGDNFIRLSDSGQVNNLNVTDVKKGAQVSVAVEAEIDVIKNAFEVFAKEGTVRMPLQEAFFSPCHGVIFDKFGVQWNLVAVK